MTEVEIENLKRQTTYNLMLQNPKPVLDDLGISYKEMGKDSYKMNIRGEKTASAFISLKSGVWKYRDFGSESGGNIINVVIDATGKDFKTALNYSLQTLNVPNYLDQALNNQTQKIEIDKASIKYQYQQNLQKEKSSQISKVTGVFDVSTNQLAGEYLKSRGIVKIPPYFKVISGEYQNKQNQTKKVFGVGLQTQSGGADIHFLHKIGDLKTFQLGEKDLSFIKEKDSKKVAVFESKMDYAAAYQQMPLDRVNVIIANSTSNAHKVAQLLTKEGLNQNVMFFNQNDKAGYEFVKNILEAAKVKDFKTIKYESNEYKKDINDLILKDIKLKDRIVMGNLQELDKNIDKFAKIGRPNVNISRADLRSDTIKLQNTKTQPYGREK